MCCYPSGYRSLVVGSTSECLTLAVESDILAYLMHTINKSTTEAVSLPDLTGFENMKVYKVDEQTNVLPAHHESSSHYAFALIPNNLYASIL